eukprot:GEMP01047191.1.p1 GENE.GEMP01047191.1~~GEMP01047191.1.p1  ORF type:complete len:416 (+),score=48.76 GEMP01047191.1:82-1329(+)
MVQRALLVMAAWSIAASAAGCQDDDAAFKELHAPYSCSRCTTEKKEYCSEWFEDDLRQYCRKSMGYCGCTDNDRGLQSAEADFGSWLNWTCKRAAAAGYCNRGTQNKRAMQTNCRFSCDRCHNYIDYGAGKCVLQAGDEAPFEIIWNLVSPLECQSRCNYMLGCTGYSFSSPTKGCILYVDYAALKVDPNDIWGDSHCMMKEATCASHQCTGGGFVKDTTKDAEDCASGTCLDAQCCKGLEGEECWTQCNKSSGPCDFCGSGFKCCRKNWNGGEKGCHTDEGAENHHVCVTRSGEASKEADKEAGKEAENQTDKEAGKEAENQTDKEAGKEAENQTDKEAGEKAENQTDIEAGKEADSDEKDCSKHQAETTCVNSDCHWDPAGDGSCTELVVSRSRTRNSAGRITTWAVFLLCLP